MEQNNDKDNSSIGKRIIILCEVAVIVILVAVLIVKTTRDMNDIKADNSNLQTETQLYNFFEK